MRDVTVRNVPDGMVDALEREARRRGSSLDRTIVDLLGERLSVQVEPAKSNGLAALAGDWSETDRLEFEAAIAITEEIDQRF